MLLATQSHPTLPRGPASPETHEAFVSIRIPNRLAWPAGYRGGGGGATTGRFTTYERRRAPTSTDDRPRGNDRRPPERHYKGTPAVVTSRKTEMLWNRSERTLTLKSAGIKGLVRVGREF